MVWRYACVFFRILKLFFITCFLLQYLGKWYRTNGPLVNLPIYNTSNKNKAEDINSPWNLLVVYAFLLFDYCFFFVFFLFCLFVCFIFIIIYSNYISYFYWHFSKGYEKKIKGIRNWYNQIHSRPPTPKGKPQNVQTTSRECCLWFLQVNFTLQTKW